MVFAAAQKSEKKSPLAGWLGKKETPAADESLPQVDVQAGLNRALKSSTAQTAQGASEADDAEHVREALGAIEAVLYAVDRIRDILEQACEVALSAKSVEEVGGRALLAESYDELRLSINEALEKIDPRAQQLIGKAPRHLDVVLAGKTRYSVSAMRLDIGEKGLYLTPPRDAFATYDEIDETLEQLDKALARADRAAGNFCRDAQYLIVRMNEAAEERSA